MLEISPLAWLAWLAFTGLVVYLLTTAQPRTTRIIHHAKHPVDK